MAISNTPTLSYHAQQFRLRVEMTRAQAIATPTCPPEIIKRARSKLEGILAEGKIAFFDLYEQKLADIWEKLRAAEHIPLNHSIGFTLAVGAPSIPGLIIEKGPNDKSAVFVSVANGSPVKTWLKEWVRTTILHKARELGISDTLSMAQVQSCLNRITVGEAVQQYPIPLFKVFAFGDLGTKAFGIVSNKARGEIAVVVNDLAAFRDAKTLETVHASVLQNVEKMKAVSPGQYRYHRQDLLDCVASALSGPEILGFGMPILVLAVTAVFTPQSASVAASSSNSRGSMSPHPVATNAAAAPSIPKYLHFLVSDDRISATITDFKTALFQDPKVKFDRAWFETQLKASGIVYGLHDDIWNKLEETWNARESLEGLLAAQGTLPVPGADPYLRLVYKEAPEVSDASKVIDIREAQQRMLVQAGQLVAERRFKTEPIVGKTVTGSLIAPPQVENKMKVGQGISQNEPGKYFATTDGLPVYDQDTLSVSKVFVHSGDVNLKSGNIRFDGPVEIKGSIDSGATVDVKGPLIIHGMIRGGFVYSKEGIDVKQGIVTTETGLVKCKGNLTASFIENSQILCSGSLTVTKAILNSRVFVGRTIIVTSDDGIAGGGLISCRDALVANNIGFPSGARTKLVLGADVRTLHRVSLREARVQKLKDTADRYRLELRELSGKKDAQMTVKHKERKEKLLKLIGKLKRIQENADTALIAAQGSVTYNSGALCVAHKRLSSNCDVEIAGQTVIIQTEMLATAISGKKRRDSHLCTAEEVKLEIDRLIAGSNSAVAAAPTPKKDPANSGKKAG